MLEILVPLVLTIIIEMPIVIKMLNNKDKYLLAGIVLINVLTNVPLNYTIGTDLIFSFYFYMSYNVFVFIAEIVVFVVEALLYKWVFNVETKKAFLVSLVANATSCLIGYILFFVF